MKLPRRSGILLHPTSLPGPHGIGDFGQGAYDFVDFLIESGQKLWQVFPLGPTGFGDSPYQCFSAFAGNPFLISLTKLQEDGFLTKNDIKPKQSFPDDKVDYGAVINFKLPLLKEAYKKFIKKANSVQKRKFADFCFLNRDWLNDYTLFMALKDHNKGKPWNQWNKELIKREEHVLDKWTEKLHNEVEYHKFVQFIFFQQWRDVKAYANTNNIDIIGDIPIFVASDSVDAWANQELFHFDENGNSTVVAGVPPDYFSATGQLWGNPLYDWDVMKKNGFQWWIKRIKAILNLVDVIRVDHFRGFEAYWEIPAGEKTAMNGQWVKAPGEELFTAVKNELGKLPIIAEDLGVITPPVEKLRDDFDFPGMKILQFAFTKTKDPMDNVKYAPHNFEKECVVYTGTHDNQTSVGWFNTCDTLNKKMLLDYLGNDGEDFIWDFMKLAISSVANTSVVPLQDVLGLDDAARMNTPGKPGGNWTWRYDEKMLTMEIRDKMSDLCAVYCR